MVDDPNKPEEITPTNADTYTPPEEQYGKQDAAPAVATPQGKNLFVFVIFLIGAAIVLYFIFGGKDKTSSNEGKTRISPPIRRIAPPAPPPIAPVAPPPAPPKPPVVTVQEPVEQKVEVDPKAAKAYKKRMQSSMLISDGGIFGGTDLGPGNSGTPGAQDAYGSANSNDPNIGFADSFFNQEGVPHAFARKLGNTGNLITQGKIIESVLETPINTDIPGMIRAVVSRDVYAESGKNILIPKGSRLVGTYNNFVIRGNTRVNVIWSRVIRPDGIDIMIRSPGADQLGRAGLEGEVDNKYLEIFSSAFLVSAINIAVAYGADQIDDSRSTETTNTDGSSTRDSTATNEAATKAVDLFGNAAENLIGDFINVKPTITIDQGTRVSVFVNRDLVFPEGLSGKVNIIK